MMKRFDVTRCPIFCIYYAGQLVHCAPTLNGFGKLESDLLAQLQISRTAGQRGKFLPENFSLNMSKHEL